MLMEAIAATAIPPAMAPETSIWLAVVAAIAAVVSSVIVGFIAWKTQGRQHAWTKEEAEAVATSLAAKVKIDAENLENNRRAEADLLASRARDESLKVSTELIDRAERTSVKVADAARLLTERFDAIQTQAKAAFDVGNHSKQDLATLTAELIALRKEVAGIKEEMTGANVPPTLEALKEQMLEISKELKRRKR